MYRHHSFLANKELTYLSARKPWHFVIFPEEDTQFHETNKPAHLREGYKTPTGQPNAPQ